MKTDTTGDAAAAAQRIDYGSPVLAGHPSDHARTSDTRPAPLLRQVVIAAVLIAVVVGAALFFDRRSAAAPRTPAAAQPPPIAVTALRVTPRDVPLESRFHAQTEPSAIVEIEARVRGTLVAQEFEDGQTVEADQVLFRIDPVPFEVALREAEAGLAAAVAQQDRARQQVARFAGLVELQQAAQNEFELAQEQLRITSASVETQSAFVERAGLDLGYAIVRSPLSGVIGERALDLGSLVGGATGVSRLATVRQVDPLYVRFSLSERDLLRWQRLTTSGQVTDLAPADYAVHVVLPDGRELPDVGRIDYVDVAVDPSTGTAVVRATVANAKHELRPGQYVKVRIEGARWIGALVVPKSAVLHSPAGASVYVVDENRLAATRRVQLEEWTEDGWIVASGLRDGDLVIVDHLMQLRPGTPVEATEKTAAEATLEPIETPDTNAAGR